MWYSKKLLSVLCSTTMFSMLGAQVVRADVVMETSPNIYSLDQSGDLQTGAQGSYPTSLALGNFDGSLTDSLGNPLNELVILGTTDPFFNGGMKVGDQEGSADYWAVTHNSSEDSQSLQANAPGAFTVPSNGPGTQWPTAAYLLNLNGSANSALDVAFLGGKDGSVFSGCDYYSNDYGPECSILYLLNNQSNEAPYFTPASFNKLHDTDGAFFGTTDNNDFFYDGLPKQDIADFNGDSLTDVAYFDFTPEIEEGINTQDPRIVVLQNNSNPASGFNVINNSLVLPLDLNPIDQRAVNAGDFNGDAIPDVALLFEGGGCKFAFSAPPALLIYYGNGDGTFNSNPDQTLALISSEGFCGDTVDNLAHGNFDGDGFADFVIGSRSFFRGGSSFNHVVLCSAASGGACTDSTVNGLGSPSIAIRNATGDFNGDGLDDLVTAYQSGQGGPRIGFEKALGFGGETSEVRLSLNQGGGTIPFQDAELADQVFQAPVAQVIDPDTGNTIESFNYVVTDLVVGDLDNCGGPDIAFSSLVCFNPYANNGLQGGDGDGDVGPCVGFTTATGSTVRFDAGKGVTFDSDVLPPGATSVVFNQVTAPVITGVTVAKASDTSATATVTCNTDGNQPATFAWTVSGVPGVTIQNADQATATFTFTQSIQGDATVTVTCSDACSSTTDSATFNVQTLLGANLVQGACGNSLVPLAAVPNANAFSMLLVTVSGFFGVRTLKRRK